MASYPFNVRVYGLLFDREEKHLLLSKEPIRGKTVIKFPGGGLQFGEGPEECVVREFQEELNIGVRVERHFYTTGFFQPSAFDPDEQVISIYYRMACQSPSLEELNSESSDESFFWESLEKIGPDLFELPIDREVGRLIEDRFSSRG